MARIASLAVALAAAAALAGCSDEPDPAALDSRPAEEIYAEAEALYDDGDTLEAGALYDEIERLYPYSQLAKAAMLRAAVAYYEAGAYEQARLGAERFLNFYPADPAAPAAQYLIANSHFDQITDVGRDQRNTRLALEALRETIARYPDSPEAREAQLKLELTQDHLAGKEMEIGRYYLKRENYVAAINRFRTVVDQYQTTSHTPEALHRLVEAYMSLGVTPEAQAAAAVLGHNFPGSAWYQASFTLMTGSGEAEGLLDPADWLGRAYRQVIQGKWL